GPKTGNPVTQQNACFAGSRAPVSRAAAPRSAASAAEATPDRSAIARSRSPSPTCAASRIRSRAASPSVFFAGEVVSPPERFAQTRPAAPCDFASSLQSSSFFRDTAAPAGTRRPRTSPPVEIAFSNGANPPPEADAVRETSGNSDRRSGRSVPYRSIASAYANRGNGATASIPAAP